MTFTEFETAINACSIGCDNSQQGKFKALTRCFDLFDRWRNEEAVAYLAALESGPDLSPRAFDASRNCLNSL